MKLTVAQIVLEQVEFKRRDDYATLAPNVPMAPSSVNLGAQLQRPEEPSNAVVVRLTASSEEGALYQFSVTFAVFYMTEAEKEDAAIENLDRQLLVTGSTMLFPFIREVVASLSGRGRFGPTWLAPTNFQALMANAPLETVPAG